MDKTDEKDSIGNTPREITGVGTNHLETRIKELFPKTSRLELPSLLDPILKEMASLDLAYADALLRHTIKKHFEFTTKEIESYERVLKAHRKVHAKNQLASERAELEKTDKSSRSQEGLMELLKKEEDLRMIEPAQDFRNGIMYFGVNIRGTLCLVTSNRELIPFGDAAARGIQLRHYLISESRFSAKGILDFIEGKREVVIPELFHKIHSYIKRFIIFPDARSLILVSLWVMGTYLFMIFRYFPYLWINAEKSSGKTLFMEILESIVFNGDLVTKPTESTIFRDVSNNRSTMLIDEMERMRNQDKDAYNAIMSVLNVGFNRSGTVKRTEKDENGGFVVKKFPVYSPKMFAGIQEIDDVLQDRAIRVPLLKKKDDEKPERFKARDSDLKLQSEIRDELYIFALQYAPEIAKLYQEESIGLDGFEHLTNRELDIWEPILILGTLIDALTGTEDITSAMKDFSKESAEEKLDDSVMKNETYQLLTVAKDMLQDPGFSPIETKGDERIYESEQVFEFFKKTDEFSWLQRKNALTMRLKKKLGVISTQMPIPGEWNKKRRVYIFSDLTIRDRCERFKIPLPPI